MVSENCLLSQHCDLRECARITMHMYLITLKTANGTAYRHARIMSSGTFLFESWPARLFKLKVKLPANSCYERL